MQATDVVEKLVHLNMPRRRLALVGALDAFLINTALWSAYFLATGRLERADAARLAGFGIAASAAAVMLMLWRGYASADPRYFDLQDLLGMAWVCGVVAFLVALAEQVWPFESGAGGPAAIPLLFGFLALALLGGARFAERRLAARNPTDAATPTARLRRTLLVGAGDVGETFAREISRSPRREHVVVGFVDDDPAKRFLRIHGLPVLGPIDDIPMLVEQHHIDEVLILIPSATGALVRHVYDLASKTRVRIRTLPTLLSIVGGSRTLSSQVRDLDIEDVLRREATPVDLRTATPYISGEHVMITGGGGSIGSELARHLTRLSPASIILLGRGENSIYEIEQELIQTCEFPPISVIADVRDARSMEWAFETYRPSVVFHAAAHKHVPLMQSNPYEAIQNNVVGTLRTAELSAKFGVKKFILLSTDKAVKPTSVMGATKRVCEMIASGLGQTSETEFSVVRFGNVLGSRGSIVPMIRAQIRRGGPVRITHRDMTRFFMTIPEAVQLIVQAGVLGSKGEIFILDMGEPVLIYDLAVDLIRLSGLVPGEDIGIEFTGIRPGEKVTEELLYDREILAPTAHDKISMVTNVQPVDFAWLRRDIQTMEDLCAAGKFEQARQFLMELAWSKSSLPTVKHRPAEG